ncbi:MAG TPA: hypothetical protein VHM92_12845 [Allosphingosinicella sp.]|nr:hypothetical protein [Allosphingosinicella sp.]
MGFKGLIAAATSVALVTAPTMAVAQQTATAAASASREVAPAAERVDGDQLRGGFIIPLIALIAIILGLCIATDQCGDGDDDLPHSP